MRGSRGHDSQDEVIAKKDVFCTGVGTHRENLESFEKALKMQV